jgi:hypothetical protein
LNPLLFVGGVMAQDSSTTAPRPLPSPGSGNRSLVVIVAVALVLVVAFTFAVILFANRQITDGATTPFVTFFTPTMINGEATIRLSSISPPTSPTKFLLQLGSVGGRNDGGYISQPVPMPTTSGASVVVWLDGTQCCRVTWTSANGSSDVTQYSVFTVTGTGSNGALPTGTTFIFSLRWAKDGSELASVPFATQ